MRVALITTPAHRHQYFVNSLISKATTKHQISLVILEDPGTRHLALSNFAITWLETRQALYEIDHLRIPEVPSVSGLTTRVLRVQNPNSEETHKVLTSKNIDFLLVYGASRITPEIYKTARHLALNCHGGLLPGFRGLDSNLWAMRYKQFESIGVTWHQMEADLDTGSVVAEERINIMGLQTLFGLRTYVAQRATAIAQELIEREFRDSTIARSHDREHSTYKSQISNKDLLIAWRNFRQYKKGI